MLSLLQWFVQKVDFVKIAEFIRLRNNRTAAARLYYALTVSYDIIDIYQILLDELRAAMLTHQKTDDGHTFFLNSARIARLLAIQSDNLEKMSAISWSLYAELRVLSKDFKPTYDELFSGKFGALWSASNLLSQARLPTGRSWRVVGDTNRTFRTLWFTWDPPTENREDTKRYLHGDDGTEKYVVDINSNDGDEFFVEIERYLREEDPYGTLAKLTDETEKLREALEKHFSISDIIGELKNVKLRRSWAPTDNARKK